MMEMHSFLKAKATEIPSPDDEENVSACDLFGFLFREKVNGFPGGNDINTQPYLQPREAAPIFQGFSPLLFLHTPPNISGHNWKSKSIREQSVNSQRNIPYSNHQTPGQDDPADQAAYYKVHSNHTNRAA